MKPEVGWVSILFPPQQYNKNDRWYIVQLGSPTSEKND